MSFSQNQVILTSIRKNGFVVIDNFLTNDELLQARQEYFKCMKLVPPHAQGEKFSPSDLHSIPWRKYAIGSKSGSGEPYSQLLQTTYFSQKFSQYPMLALIFEKMIGIRNTLTDMRPNYGSDLENDDFWNACRVHHYPVGGGHMAAHTDTLFPKLLADFEFPFIQIMVTLTNRYSDFIEGGGYVVSKSGEKIYFETAGNAGSLVLFDGNTVHGVDDIDPKKLLDLNSEAGRIALFVNLYSNFNKSRIFN